jgi:predicted nucleic acid-binding protein
VSVFVDTIEASPRVRVEQVDPETESAALAWLRVRDEREYSFVDATSFAVMRARRTTDALAFDGDFTAAGFTELRP